MSKKPRICKVHVHDKNGTLTTTKALMVGQLGFDIGEADPTEDELEYITSLARSHSRGFIEDMRRSGYRLIGRTVQKE
jgi:hypothetical protein